MMEKGHKDMSEDTALIKQMEGVLHKIKLGFQLHKENVVREAFEEGENLLSRLTDKQTIGFLNSQLGNACLDLFSLNEYKKDKKNTPLSETLQKAKTFFRNALRSVKDQNPHFEKQVWVNYGNCLDSLGRGVEALYAYDEALKIDPKFAMAIGNKAITSQHFATISGSYTSAIHIDAYQAIKEIIDDKALVKVGGLGAKRHFEAVLQNIEAMVTDKKVLQKRITHLRYDDSALSDFENFYVRFCIAHKLFLNFHLHDDTCEAALSDPIFISIVTSIDDTTTFYGLAHYINQIKEDYVVARLLLVQSQLRRQDFDSISRRTTFVNPLDYSQTNIYTGLLKSAYKEAFNILDKISVFLNKYYNLGLKESSIYFDTIWVKDKKKDPSMRREILNSENMSLYALYDIFRDFQSGYFTRMKDIRRALTHRRLTIFELGSGEINNDGELVSVTSGELVNQTIQLMRLVKAAIIYLINTVALEENKKNMHSDKRLGNIEVNTTQFIPPFTE
jgi:tetratricopeptide (TPR) repeat protein